MKYKADITRKIQYRTDTFTKIQLDLFHVSEFNTCKTIIETEALENQVFINISSSNPLTSTALVMTAWCCDITKIKKPPTIYFITPERYACNELSYFSKEIVPLLSNFRLIVKEKPEELQRLIDIADLRERAIVSMLALGGFREGTLVRLKYRHVREDLEKGTEPLHIHVEAAITKGKYHDYDTFIGKEAVAYLHEYLETRRLGSPDGKMPPEDLTDESPLIRDKTSRKPKPIGEKQIYKLVHSLYFKVGLLKKGYGRLYSLKVHSIRKYFKTQLLALGVQSDYVDYMMGHTIDTYHDIQMKGIEFLRNIYAASGLSIRPKTETSKIEALKEIIRAWGLDPEKILTREAMSTPHRILVSPEEIENKQIRILCNALKTEIKKELTLTE